MPPAKRGTTPSSGLSSMMKNENSKFEAKARFEQLNAQNAELDVLTRCKKLNEFLSSDFLAPGSDSKASKQQLTEMLAILNGPKQRPSFLDKPSVLDTAAKKKTAPASVSPTKQAVSGLSDFPDQLLDLLEETEKIENTAMKPRQPIVTEAVVEPEEDGLDDLIGLLNPDAAQSRHDEDERLQNEARRLKQEEEAKLKADAEKAEQARRDLERRREEEERQKRMEEEEKARREQEARQRLEKEEEEKIRRELEAREGERQEVERQLRLKQEAEEQERKRGEAVVILQRYSRRYLAIQSAEKLRREAASLVIQSRYRAWKAARQLHILRACDSLRRRRAARIIANAYQEYRRQWRLNPVKAPAAPSLNRDSLDGHSHILELPVRVRNASDLRSAPDNASSAPEASGSSSSSMEHTASGRRTVDSARKRVSEVKGSESRVRDADSARMLKAASAHRTFESAIQEVKKGKPTAQTHLPPKAPKAK